MTYRLALAVYTRSPSAYESLRSFGILQLPCRRSLQDFMSSNEHEQSIADQRNLYDAFKSQRKRKGKKKPRALSVGLLIFDEVKVQNKVLKLPLFQMIIHANM